MNIKSQSPLSKTVYIIVAAFLIASCQPTPLPTQNPNDSDIQDIRVQAAEPTKTTSKVEQFPLPNCGGSDKLAQSLGTFASVSKSATVGAKATVTGGGEVAIPETAKLKLEIQVELAYQQTFESANSRLDTIVMSAAAGTHVVYTIVWEEQTFDSIVQYSSDGKVYDVPYTYKLSIPKIDKSYNVVCDGNNTAPAIENAQSVSSTVNICTDETWVEPSSGNFAVIQNVGVDSVHQIDRAQPIWGEHVEPNSSTILERSFTLPDDATNISGTVTFNADDGVTLFLNSDEVGNYDAQVWPPPLTLQLTNLRPGINQFRAEVYNRPTSAWFEACANITYTLPSIK